MFPGRALFAPRALRPPGTLVPCHRGARIDQEPATPADFRQHATEGPPDIDLLERLRSSDAPTRDAALKEVLDLVARSVSGKLGPKARNIELQPESIAQSVVGAHLKRIVANAESDESVRRNLVGQAHRTMINRLRRLGAKQRAALEWLRLQGVSERDAIAMVSQEFAPGSIDTAGPSTQAEANEAAALDSVAMRRLHALVERTFDSLEDRDLCRFYLIESRGAAEVGNMLGLQPGAIRTRTTRLRAKLGAAVIDAVRDTVPALAMQLAELVFVERASWRDACSSAGIDAANGAAAMRNEILPAIMREFGSEGCRVMLRCLPPIGGSALGSRDER